MANVTDDGVFNIYRFFNTQTGTHFFTSSDAERDNVIATLPQFNFEGNVFDSNAVVGGADVTSVFRFFNTQTGTHFFTSNEAEKDNIIATLPDFSFEGIAYQAFNAPGTEREAVFRFFNTETGTHFYTSNEAEKDNIIATLPQFNFEGITYYVGGPAITGGPAPTDPTDPTSTAINLTANADTTTATTPAANTLGTSNIEIYSGVYDPTGNATTISNADVLDGAGGTDALNIRIASTTAAAGGDTIAPVSSNVENFFLKNQSTTDTFTLNFINITDEVQVWDKSSVSNATTVVLNVDPTATAGIADSSGVFFGVNFSGEGDRSGTSDAFTLALKGAGATGLTFFSTVTSDGGRTDDTFEIANISSTATPSNVLLGTPSSMTLKTVNVSGDAALMLDGILSFIGLSTVNASQMTAGGLNIDARGSEEANFNFTGSSADDRVVLKNSTINTASSLDGGGSKDTLATQNFNNLNVTAVNGATGFEVLEGVGGAENISSASFTGINEFLFSGTTDTNNGFDISNIESNDRIAYSTDISSGGNHALRLNGKNAGNTATVELRAIDETNGETALTATSNTNDRYGIELQSNISSFTLDSTGTSTNANVIETNQNNNFFGYAFGNTTTPVFKITGSHDVTLMAKAGVDISDGTKLAGFSDAANIDASAFTGILRIAGSLSDDVIKGGSGSDIIYSLGGTDTLTGNNGTDQFRLAEFYNTTDTITDFVKGTDKVGLNQFDFGNTTATQAGATLSTTDYVDNRAGITSIGSADAKKVIELQTSLSSSQIAADAGAAVEAYVLVHNTTSGKAELWYDDNWSDAGSRSHIVTYDNVVDLVGVQGFSNSDFVEYTY